MSNAVDPIILKLCAKVTGKRPKTVIDHIIKYGSITSEDLKDTYGYNHPPRAIRDVREAGIPLETFKVVGSDGRKIGAYRFDDPSKIENHKLAGRQTFSKAFKQQLIKMYGEKCFISGLDYESRYLQIDHRIPYEVAGDNVAEENQPDQFMLITATAQRQKSWSCENCNNLKTEKRLDICSSCYWAYPENYTHAAGRDIRKLNIEWSDQDVDTYDKIKKQSEIKGLSMQDYIKITLK
jgi:hypothetical protein